ncbi:histone-binding protein msi1 [Anaeramoeba ignava]|uniref:Histone-binding protein msi1 n=1 Tax=Anaeramoeba ignava TaxID=1746090 RepID=A0A9Q0LTS6_ANAIG|nr:histone-binding protein msi1 [Anaeramoeba ignava]
MAAPEHFDKSKIIEEEFSIWKKNAPFLYDLLFTFPIETEISSIEWFPINSKNSTQNSKNIQEIVLGSKSKKLEDNFLYFLSINIPIDETQFDSQENQKSTIQTKKQNLEDHPMIRIVDKIQHQGNVNKVRIMPQNSNIISTITNKGKIFIYDISKISNTYENINQKEKQILNKNPILEYNISEGGNGLSWNYQKEGFLLTGNYKGEIDIFNINAEKKETIQNKKMDSEIKHVSWHKKRDSLFGVTSKNKKFTIFDTRELTGPLYEIEGHEGEVNYLDFHPHSEFIFATCSSDHTVKLWDIRVLPKYLHVLSKHEESVNCVKWNPFILNSTILSSSGEDQKIAIWDLEKIGKMQEKDDIEDGPPELLFLHAGHINKINDFDWSYGESWTIGSIENDFLQIWQITENIYNEEQEQIEIESKSQIK